MSQHSLPRKGIKESLSYAKTRDEITSTVAIPELLENAVHLKSEAEKHRNKNIKAVHYLYAPLLHDRIEYDTRLVVKETNAGEMFYHKLIRDKKGPVADLEAYSKKSIDLPSIGRRPKSSTPEHTSKEALAGRGAISISDFLSRINEQLKDDPKFQNAENPKGAVSFNNSETLINLFNSADMSTFL